MDFIQAQDLFKNMFPGKTIKYEFDEKCHRFHELTYTDGIPNAIHHIENNKVKVTVQGMDSQYVSIKPHRECCSWETMKKMINSKEDPQNP